MIKLYFSRNLRLLTQNNFSFVFNKARRVCTKTIIVLGRTNQLAYPRIGLSISKKCVKYAYHRNRIKRLARESFRQRQHYLLTMDFIVISKKEILNLNNKELIKEFEKIWYRYYR
ncbi:Ribonuclease P protein component [Candidatus Ecksteinia adelgidicola]|nr:Ribonuclease P protein component [Candidatus Ecksteinia adelgidicola]